MIGYSININPNPNLQQVTTGVDNAITDNTITITDAEQERFVEIDGAIGVKISTSGTGNGVRINADEVTDQDYGYDAVPIGGAMQVLGNVTSGVDPAAIQAVNGANYDVLGIGRVEFTDPIGSDGRGYRVFVTRGEADLGGVVFQTGSYIFRMFDVAFGWKNVVIGTSRAIYYVTSQDVTGFFNVQPRYNNTGINFVFSRTNVGEFVCAAFDKLSHKISAIIVDEDFNSKSSFTYSEGDAAFFTTKRNIAGTNIETKSDDCFAFGGFIIIEVLPI